MGTSHPLRPLLLHALEHAERTDPGDDLLELAWLVAEHDRDRDLLATLCTVERLPAPLRERLKNVTALEVRVAFLRRSDLTQDERDTLLRNERRAGALTELAEAADTDPDVLRTLAEHRTVTVALAVMRNTAAPIDARRTAAWRVAAAPGTKANAAAEIGSFVAADADARDEHACRITNVAVLGVLCGTGPVNPNASRHVVGTLLDHLAANPNETAAVNTLHCLSKLVANSMLDAGTLTAASAVLEHAAEHTPNWFDAVVRDTAAHVAGQRNGKLRAALDIARTGTDPDELDRIVHARQFPMVLTAVACNPAASVETTRRAVALHTTMRGDGVARAGQRDVLAALVRDGAWPALVGWKPDDADHLLDLLRDDTIPPLNRRFLLQRAPAAVRTAVADCVPLELFGGDPLRPDHLTSDVYDHAVAVLRARAKGIRPDILVALAESFTGGVGPLCDTAELLEHDPVDAPRAGPSGEPGHGSAKGR